MPGKHAVEVCKAYRCDLAIFVSVKNIPVVIDVRIDPIFNVTKVSVVACSSPYQVLTVKVERFCIAPGTKILRRRKPLHCRLDHSLGPVDALRNLAGWLPDTSRSVRLLSSSFARRGNRHRKLEEESAQQKRTNVRFPRPHVGSLSERSGTMGRREGVPAND